MDVALFSEIQSQRTATIVPSRLKIFNYASQKREWGEYTDLLSKKASSEQFMESRQN